MQEFVARENIRRFEAQLAQCDDDSQRLMLRRLLKAERKRLNEILGGSGPSLHNGEDRGDPQAPLAELSKLEEGTRSARRGLLNNRN